MDGCKFRIVKERASFLATPCRSVVCIITEDKRRFLCACRTAKRLRHAHTAPTDPPLFPLPPARFPRLPPGACPRCDEPLSRSKQASEVSRQAPCLYLRFPVLSPKQVDPEDAVVAEHHRVPRRREVLHPVSPLAGHPGRALLQGVALHTPGPSSVGRKRPVPHSPVPFQERGHEPARATTARAWRPRVADG